MFLNGFQKTVAIKSSACNETNCAIDPFIDLKRFCQWFWTGKNQFEGKKDRDRWRTSFY